jgi:hypothetical protein
MPRTLVRQSFQDASVEQCISVANEKRSMFGPLLQSDMYDREDRRRKAACLYDNLRAHVVCTASRAAARP